MELLDIVLVLGLFPLLIWTKLQKDVPDIALFICPVISCAAVGIPAYLFGGVFWTIISLVVLLIISALVYAKGDVV